MSAARKLAQIAAIMVATLVAGWLSSGVVAERESRQRELSGEFSRTWGPTQGVHAPVLVVPYRTAEGRPRQYLKIAPTTLAADARLTPELRRRGLFTAAVYGAAVTMNGSFTLPPQARLSSLVEATGAVAWDQAFVAVEAAGFAGMAAADGFAWNGAAVPWRACRELVEREEHCQGAVLAARVAMKPEGGVVPFQLALTLRGTGAFTLVPEARQASLTLAAPWPNPSFTGAALPNAATVTPSGFEARWTLSDPAGRQMWSASAVQDGDAARTRIGVDLLEPVPTYRMVHRVSKYAILIVTLCFTAAFLFELLSGLRIHAIQYGLLGASLTLFPLLLVSLAEPLGFASGYGASAAMVLVQASAYTAAVTRRGLAALGFAVLLAGLFAFLYVLLSLETYALLAGSLALFVALSAVMALTGKVDWWGERA